ncbi:hypothetical protein ACFLWD_00775 [Chloroflexota bacterium]
MKIDIKSPEQFGRLLNALVKECVNAEIYFKLHKDLLTAIPEYKQVFIQSNTFWSLTSHALLDATLSRLCRAYDQHQNSLSLINLIDTIDQAVNDHRKKVRQFSRLKVRCGAVNKKEGSSNILSLECILRNLVVVLCGIG